MTRRGSRPGTARRAPTTRNPAARSLKESAQAGVRRLAGEVLAAYPRLDVLVNNPGGF
jgi:NAD(P)-dependent dehydrogenase (short-subunit alcohol dehydrogenase family)